ncbi:unnamed protein product [Heligmosomoides polygyrus]|uniref:Uncharacterized protein n=1 Tax=Heligmosomoides polygyrus TaxID=6339 RepID=A0A183GUR4_HELPZ|nr:unnamed protein product [Heligmosomoides polygyrus]
MQRLEQQQADYTATKSKEVTLSEPTFLAYDNVTQVWRVPQLDVSEMEDIPNACFKSTRALGRNGRIKQDDHIVSCVDFFRKYLRTACDPPQLIQRYATMKASASKRQKTSQASILEGNNSASRNVRNDDVESIVDSTEEEDEEEDEGDEDTAEGETETDNPDELLMLSA